MGELGEAVGGAIEGGLYARAVEPKAGEGGATGEGACLNCGTALAGAYCRNCGQKAHVHRTIGAIMHDVLHGALHLDGKIWHTLPLLALKPGQLTRRYIEGERAKFVSPMALFLFSVFLMFAVFQLTGVTADDELATPVRVEDNRSPAEIAEEARTDLEQLQEARAAVPDANPVAPILDAQIRGLERQVAGGGTSRITVSENRTGLPIIDRLSDKWRENPGLMIYKLQANAYKFSWLLIPISIPFVWLLFAWRRRFKAYDHAVFVTYSLSFMTLLFVTLSLLGKAGLPSGWLVAGTLLVPPAHIYKQLRDSYGLSRFSAAWRLVALLFFIVIIVTLFLQVLLVLGAY